MDSLTVDSAADPTVFSWILLGLMGLAAVLVLYCVLTIYRNPYFDEVHKFGWLFIALAFPIFGPLAWIVRARLEKKYRVSRPAGSDIEEESSRKAAAPTTVYHPGQSVLFSSSSRGAEDESDDNSALVERGDGTRGLSF